MLDWAVSILPLSTLLTALAFWFGFAMTVARYGYWGIDVSTLGFSTADYLVRSVDALMVPTILLLTTWLVLLGIHAVTWPIILRRRVSAPVRNGLIVLCILGLATLGLSIFFAFVDVPPEIYLLPPLLLGGGSISLAHGLRGLLVGEPDSPRRDGTSSRRYRPVQVTLTALLIVSLFWGATLHAGALGRGRAIEFAAKLSSRPAVTVYSRTSLALPPPVVETLLDIPNSEYQFKYTNLRLVIRSSEKYFLLSEAWAPSTGIAVILHDTPDVRFEFQPGKAQK